MSRTFTSTRAALGHALAVQGHAAGLAHLSDGAGGPAPNHALASDVMACIRRAGLDPHDGGPVLEAVKAWATAGSSDIGAQLAGKLDAALRRIGESLADAGLLVPAPRIEPVTWRAVEVAGIVRYHACTDDHGAPDLKLLQQRVENGLEAPERAVVMPQPPDPRIELLDACAVAFVAGDLDTRELDEAIAAELGVQLPRARQLRRGAGIIGQRGRPKKGIDRQEKTTGSPCQRTT